MAKKMKIFECIVCKNFSFSLICKNCQKEFLSFSPKIKDNILYFYEYEEIEFLLKYKYHPFGDSIIKIIADNSLKIFAQNIKEKFFLIPIDDTPKNFSHTAILAKSMQTKYLKPIFNSLKAQNKISYAGKSLEFRLNNPRNFIYTGPKNIDAILIDDIATTHTTLNEAQKVLEENNVKVYLKIVLAHA
jgi:competence protein ComFC